MESETRKALIQQEIQRLQQSLRPSQASGQASYLPWEGERWTLYIVEETLFWTLVTVELVHDTNPYPDLFSTYDEVKSREQGVTQKTRQFAGPETLEYLFDTISRLPEESGALLKESYTLHGPSSSRTYGYLTDIGIDAYYTTNAGGRVKRHRLYQVPSCTDRLFPHERIFIKEVRVPDL